MKKLLMTLTMSSALLLAACGGEEPTDTENETTEETTEQTTENTSEETADQEASGEDLQDGTYRIEETQAGGSGWQESLEMTVEGGEITDATFESVDEDGNQKIDDEEYQEMMAEASGVGPQEFIPALEDSFVETQSPEDVEVVSGATGTSEKVQDYGSQLVEAAQEGNTEMIEVDNAEE